MLATALIIAGVLLALWCITCIQYPYVTCWHCEGKKRKYAKDEVHYGHVECFWCDSRGERYRFPLRVLALL